MTRRLVIDSAPTERGVGWSDAANDGEEESREPRLNTSNALPTEIETIEAIQVQRTNPNLIPIADRHNG